MMGTLNYTTTVSVTRTAGEVQALLAEAGADAVAIRYMDRQPVGVSFALNTPQGQRHFDLPVNVAGVHKLLTQQAKSGQLKKTPPRGGWATPEHAARVAWLIAKDWLEAQLALIQAQMVTLEEVMLPYLRLEGGQTLYQAYVERGRTAIETGGPN